MKMMFPLLNECGKKLNTILANIPIGEGFDIKDMSARFTTDAIGSCAFGLETNSLDNPDSEFRRMGKRIFKFRYVLNREPSPLHIAYQHDKVAYL